MIEPDFHFISQENVEIVGITPLARSFINNLLLLDKTYDILYNSSIHRMDDSIYYYYDKKLFNITGIINHPQPKFTNKSIVLMINLQSEEKIKINVDCNVNDINGLNYTLKCTSREYFYGNLQSSISFIDDGDILLINFVNSTQSIIKINESEYYNLIFKKSSRGLSAGAIVAIICVPIAVIALIIYIVAHFHFKNKRISKIEFDNSTNRIINNW